MYRMYCGRQGRRPAVPSKVATFGVMVYLRFWARLGLQLPARWPHCVVVHLRLWVRPS